MHPSKIWSVSVHSLSINFYSLEIAYSLLFNSPYAEFPWDDLRKISPECQQGHLGDRCEIDARFTSD